LWARCPQILHRLKRWHISTTKAQVLGELSHSLWDGYHRPVRGLLLSLSKLEVNPDSFVRIITFFDELVRHRASLDALVRSAAALAECPAGLSDDFNGVVLCFNEDGSPHRGTADEPTVAKDILIDEVRVGSVWLQRPAEPQQFDEMLIERMALAAAALWQHDLGRDVTATTEPALLELVLSPRTGDIDRSRSLRLLGFSEIYPLRALAVTSDAAHELPGTVHRLVCELREGGLNQARGCVIGLKGAVLAQYQAPLGANGHVLPQVLRDRNMARGTRVGVGPLVDPAGIMTSWQAALSALRLSSTWLRSGGFIESDELGAAGLLADIPVASLEACKDLQVLDELASHPKGQRDIQALESLLRTGSLRQAAADMHLHHSSVAARLRHVEDALGLSLSDPIGHVRAEVAVALWRLLQSARKNRPPAALNLPSRPRTVRASS